MFPAIAAFRIVARDGLIPHAKHGGRGVCGPADLTSKLEGTGFESEHIVHIQVALDVDAAATG